MAVRFVVVPEWQGSGSSRAMSLMDGAEAIRGDLPGSATTAVEVPLEAGDAEGTGIPRFSSLRVVRQRFARAVEHLTDPVVLIGGDCAAEYAAVQHAAAGGPMAVVWFDAHPDANTTDSSPSHDFNGMVLRALADDGHVDPGRIVLAGTRVRDDEEDRWIGEHAVPVLDPAALRDPGALVAAVAATGVDRVYLHVDLDVLDPSEFEGVSEPQPFGVGAGELVAAVRAVRDRFRLAGAGITQFSPASDESAAGDLGTILRLVGAITSGA